MISALEHWAYCPRQCGLIHVEQVYEENVFTLRGLLSDIAAPPQRAFGRRRRYCYTWVRPSGETLRAVSRWAEQGSLRPLIHAVYPLSGVADAHRQLERGSVRGKLVIDHAAY